MDLIVINELIDELENADTSLSNIRNLSALYTVKRQILGNTNLDNTIKELKDILPSYINYVETKRKFQLNEVSIENVETQLKSVCREIKEFIQTLYSGTDTELERDLISNLIKDLKEIG